MIWVLNIDVAIGIMRSAFNPLSCAVEVYDYQKLVRLRVFDPDSTVVISALTLSMRDVVDPSILRAKLQQARAIAETKGLKLRSWTVPGWQTHLSLSKSVDVGRPGIRRFPGGDAGAANVDW